MVNYPSSHHGGRVYTVYTLNHTLIVSWMNINPSELEYGHPPPLMNETNPLQVKQVNKINKSLGLQPMPSGDMEFFP